MVLVLRADCSPRWWGVGRTSLIGIGENKTPRLLILIPTDFFGAITQGT